MTRDELRDSQGKRCIVTDLRTGKRHAGVIEVVNDDFGRAHVRYDADGVLYRVGHGFIRLEKP